MNTYFVWMLILIEFDLFLRMIFISITDVSQLGITEVSVVIDTSSDAWPGLLFGEALSEVIAAYLLLIILYFTNKIENIITDFYT